MSVLLSKSFGFGVIFAASVRLVLADLTWLDHLAYPFEKVIRCTYCL